jgi:hypothetical protein
MKISSISASFDRRSEDVRRGCRARFLGLLCCGQAFGAGRVPRALRIATQRPVRSMHHAGLLDFSGPGLFRVHLVNRARGHAKVFAVTHTPRPRCSSSKTSMSRLPSGHFKLSTRLSVSFMACPRRSRCHARKPRGTQACGDAPSAWFPGAVALASCEAAAAWRARPERLQARAAIPSASKATKM